MLFLKTKQRQKTGDLLVSLVVLVHVMSVSAPAPSSSGEARMAGPFGCVKPQAAVSAARGGRVRARHCGTDPSLGPGAGHHSTRALSRFLRASCSSQRSEWRPQVKGRLLGPSLIGCDRLLLPSLPRGVFTNAAAECASLTYCDHSFSVLLFDHFPLKDRPAGTWEECVSFGAPP